MKAAKDTALSSSAQKKGRLLREKIRSLQSPQPEAWTARGWWCLRRLRNEVRRSAGRREQKVDLAFKPPRAAYSPDQAAKIAAAAETPSI